LGWWTLEDTIGADLEAATPGETGALLPAGAGETPAPIRSLAVLPLDDFSEEEGGEYFTAGLHEEIVLQLSQTGAARILSRTSVVQYDRSGKTMPAIASDLGVDAVVEGSVFRSGDRVRITVQLIHGPTDTHLWANSYEGTVEDAIALQREVAQAIAAEIGAELSGEGAEPVEPTRVARSVPIPEEYRRGRHDEVEGTPEALASAVQHYEKVLEGDSSFTPARAGLAQVRLRLESRPDAPGEVPSPEQRINGARRLASAAHYREAEGVLRKLALEGDDDAAEEAWEALEQIKAVQGDFQAVIGLKMERLSRGLGDSHDSIALLALEGLVQEKGEEGYWVWKVEDLEKLAADGVEISPVEYARARVGVGDLEAALPYLETAVDVGDRNLVTLWTDPAWDVLRQNPRFKEILLRVRRFSPRGGHPFPDWP
jgi:TolB-like protein